MGTLFACVCPQGQGGRTSVSAIGDWREAQVFPPIEVAVRSLTTYTLLTIVSLLYLILFQCKQHVLDGMAGDSPGNGRPLRRFPKVPYTVMKPRGGVRGSLVRRLPFFRRHRRRGSPYSGSR